MAETRKDITRILHEIPDRPEAAAELLPLVYDELRALARARMAQERPGHTLRATALVASSSTTPGAGCVLRMALATALEGLGRTDEAAAVLEELLADAAAAPNTDITEDAQIMLARIRPTTP